MGLLYDYFTAPDDAAAAEVIDWAAGPSVRDEQAGIDPYPSAHVIIDPGTQLTWVAMMETDPSGTVPESELGKILVVKNEGDSVVCRLSAAAHDALARLAVEPDNQGALTQLEGLGEPDTVVEAASELITLATVAKDRGWSLYVWYAI